MHESDSDGKIELVSLVIVLTKVPPKSTCCTTSKEIYFIFFRFWEFVNHIYWSINAQGIYQLTTKFKANPLLVDTFPFLCHHKIIFSKVLISLNNVSAGHIGDVCEQRWLPKSNQGKMVVRPTTD